MNEFISKATEICISVGGKIILALIIYIVGRFVIGRATKIFTNMKAVQKMDQTVRGFLMNFITFALYVVLGISIISVLGVPMASVITVLASAGVAIGMALQGSLSNLAGGIMLLIFHPFKAGEYIAASGEEGTVREITLFYTVLITVDNRKITIPNGTLMNANVTNFSSEPLRRVDLVFSCAKGEDVEKIRQIMLDIMNKNSQVLKDPAPFARLSGGTNESMDFTVRAWTNGPSYWDVYFNLTQGITEAMGAAGVKAPAVRVLTEKIG